MSVSARRSSPASSPGHVRHRARRILIVYPAGLQVQWQEQMRDKFKLDKILDTALMRDLRRRRNVHVNPWGHHPRPDRVDGLRQTDPPATSSARRPAAPTAGCCLAGAIC